MEIKLEAVEDTSFQIGFGLKFVDKGEVIEAKFTELGVSLKLGGSWTLPFRHTKIEGKFKAYNQ